MLNLFQAVRASDLLALKYWIEKKKADINQKDNEGFTPFLRAAQSSDLKTLQWLAERGADVQLKYSKAKPSRSALYFMLFTHEGKPEWQAEKASWLLSQGFSLPESFKLVLANDLTTLQRRYEKSPSLLKETEAEAGYSLLHLAAGLGQLPTVLWLLKKEFSESNANNILGRTLLHVAALNGHLAILQYAQKQGADLQIKDKEGATPLHLAARNGHIETVKWLVREGKAQVETIENEDGWTPLHLAARNGHVAVVEWLVRKGKAKVEVENRWNDTPLQVAIYQKHLAVQYWLRAYELFTQLAKADSQSDGFAPYLKLKNVQLLSEVDQYTGTDKPILVVSLMRLYLEALTVANRELQSDLLNTSVLKYQSRLFSVLDQPAQQTFLQAFIKLGLIELIKALGCQQLTSLTLQHIEFGTLQAKALTTLLQFNPTLTSLNLQCIDLSLQDLLDVLTAYQPNLQTLTLNNSQLTDHHFFCLLPALLKCTALQRLDLSGNLLSLISLKNLLTALNKQPHPALAELSFAHNYIEIADVRLFQALSSTLPEHSLLKTIELSGNALWSEKHNKALKSVWQLLLKRSHLTVQDLVDAEFIKLGNWPGQYNKFLLQLKLSNQTVKDIQLTQQDVEVLHAFQSSIGEQTEVQAFKYFKTIPKDLIPMTLRQHSITNLLTDDAAQNRFCKQILDYYPTSPLKGHLRTHPVFKSTPCAAIKSLIMPELPITLSNWQVYLISTNNNNPLEDHAMIAYEGLTQYGQRFLKVVHLIAQQQSSLAKDYKIKAEYFAGHPYKDSKGLASTVFYLTQCCTFSALPATRQQVNQLDQAVQKEMAEGVNASYKWLIGSVQSKQARQTEVQNCLKWALDKLNKHLFIGNSEKIQIMVYIPSQVVSALNAKHAERVQKAKQVWPDPVLLPKVNKHGDDVKEGKQENNNNNSTSCLVM